MADATRSDRRGGRSRTCRHPPMSLSSDSRSSQRPQAQLYGFGLRQPIPAFPIPLQSDEPEPLLDLQPLLHQVYDRARFELAIDYQVPLKPGLF